MRAKLPAVEEAGRVGANDWTPARFTAKEIPTEAAIVGIVDHVNVREKASTDSHR